MCERYNDIVIWWGTYAGHNGLQHSLGQTPFVPELSYCFDN